MFVLINNLDADGAVKKEESLTGNLSNFKQYHVYGRSILGLMVVYVMYCNCNEGFRYVLMEYECIKLQTI